jgi:predicted ATP-grasp superfamily ATP-dependent carboligase
MPQNDPEVKGKPAVRVFVYEYFTATGLGREPGSPDHGIYLEGRAMRDALAEDFARIPRVEVLPFADEAGASGGTAFWRTLQVSARITRDADWIVAIAPEFDDILADVITEGRHPRSQVLAPLPWGFRLACDKLALAEHWREHGVPTPATTEREPTACELFPIVWKPRDGAGSTDTFLIRDRFELAQALAARDPSHSMILQEFVTGRAASVAFLSGPRGYFPLVPTFQLVSDDGRLKYRGGELPIPPDLAERAVKLGQRAVECVSGLLGYVGVDLVLGDAGDGSGDRAIEINPRLTTSYIGLRALADFNIAEVMLRIAAGETGGQLRWKPGRVRFGPDGGVGFL